MNWYNYDESERGMTVEFGLALVGYFALIGAFGLVLGALGHC